MLRVLFLAFLFLTTSRVVAQAPALADAPRAELETLRRFLDAPSWPRRAIAAMRFERYGCDESRAQLTTMLEDRAWQVRAYAVRALARRRVPQEATWFEREKEPRVIRAALRYRYAIDADRLARGVRALDASSDLADRLLGAEIGAASGVPELEAIAVKATNEVILRMDRPQGGAFSPRLAWLTGAADLRSSHRWKRWRLKTGRGFEVQPGFLIDDGTAAIVPQRLATLPPERFAALEDYMQKLADRRVDLAICLDCTASMSGELRAAQGGIDDLMIFVGDVALEVRVGVIAYRDRRNRDFEVRGWPFTSDLAVARTQLWTLEADGGGDRRESVGAALRQAYTELQWMPDREKVLVLIGDAAPHVGDGAHCADMARRAAGAGLTTHAIEAAGKPVEHFAEIAGAGGGRCVTLEDDGALIPEIAGLTLGDVFAEEFREFFEVYLRLCR